ncbi:hypothetical protein [Sinorhizobium meliloti]|uniref:hypothetical protein n=1 Tax=Rhizobium meliloti TaxID=382 RepID=UPI000FD73EDA|nr:hypothetical protein [Sinorhizobium meliloti]RVG98639.1 hypothetical protein CN210_30555 [Sinorhizobium meliloti]
MSEWIDFERWPDRKSMERPGIVFEVTNGDQTLLTDCVVPLPLPSDWVVHLVRFRAVPQPRPRHSAQIPEPVDR